MEDKIGGDGQGRDRGAGRVCSAKSGMRVLDLASGTGEPAISLAMRVGSQGHVTALDLSADLLEIAKARALDRGFEKFSHSAGRCTRTSFYRQQF